MSLTDDPIAVFLDAIKSPESETVSAKVQDVSRFSQTSRRLEQSG
jgi:hypothetical protein